MGLSRRFRSVTQHFKGSFNAADHWMRSTSLFFDKRMFYRVLEHLYSLSTVLYSWITHFPSTISRKACPRIQNLLTVILSVWVILTLCSDRLCSSVNSITVGAVLHFVWILVYKSIFRVLRNQLERFSKQLKGSNFVSGLRARAFILLIGNSIHKWGRY